jgi:hypothetical protein
MKERKKFGLKELEELHSGQKDKKEGFPLFFDKFNNIYYCLFSTL